MTVFNQKAALVEVKERFTVNCRRDCIQGDAMSNTRCQLLIGLVDVCKLEPFIKGDIGFLGTSAGRWVITVRLA
ncbi:hypothetical protein K6U51_11940, partial [Vibrio fluvialis]|uniref:hypothetical protein n=1 Tax=Vibrio fluvialis TaxID=676 RepID=UPI001EECBAA7